MKKRKPSSEDLQLTELEQLKAANDTKQKHIIEMINALPKEARDKFDASMEISISSVETAVNLNQVQTPEDALNVFADNLKEQLKKYKSRNNE